MDLVTKQLNCSLDIFKKIDISVNYRNIATCYKIKGNIMMRSS